MRVLDCNVSIYSLFFFLLSVSLFDHRTYPIAAAPFLSRTLPEDMPVKVKHPQEATMVLKEGTFLVIDLIGIRESKNFVQGFPHFLYISKLFFTRPQPQHFPLAQYIPTFQMVQRT